MEEAIKDRIQKIMDAEQLSAAKFADTVGVQRSLVSHILNERNKPGTDITNFQLRYIYKDGRQVAQTESVKARPGNVLFNNIPALAVFVNLKY